MSYGKAIRILEEFETDLRYTDADVMRAIDTILSMETINAVTKESLLRAVRFLRERV